MTTAITIEAAATLDTLPTAYSDDVKKFFKVGCTAKRDILMKELKEVLLSNGVNYNSLFPNRTKRKDMLNYLLLLTSVSGIVAVESKTIADRVGCSVDYVFKSMPLIKESGLFIVTGLADGKNKYVFVLKSHPNFKRIIREVFYMDVVEPITEQTTEQSTEQETAINPVTPSPNADILEGQSLKSFKPLITEHEKSVIQHTVENEATKVINKAESIDEAEMYLTAYIDNPIQLQLFRNIHDFPFPEEIQRHATALVLRTGLNGYVTNRIAIKAIQVLNKIAVNLLNRVEMKSVVAVFSYEMFNVGSNPYKKEIPEAVTIPAVKKVPFYNWVEERE